MIIAHFVRFINTGFFLILITILFESSCKDQEVSATANADSNSLIGNPLPDTGQVTSYTITRGEDSDFEYHAPSFRENGDGTITDNNTGLMWQKSDGGEMTYENAASYCQTLSLGGYHDWRLPTSHELFLIHIFDNVNPALNTVYFTKTTAEYWWSSEARADLASNVWVTNAGGGIGAHPKSETLSAGGTRRFHIRAVRNSKVASLPAIHFKENGDGTITDNYTGLIWQQFQSNTSLTWEEALAYAAGLTLAGKSDWRVPNIKELQSINDEKLYMPSFNKSFFPKINAGNFWSSTSQVNSPAKAWDLNVDFGIVSYSDKLLRQQVLCVRGGNQ